MYQKKAKTVTRRLRIMNLDITFRVVTSVNTVYNEFPRLPREFYPFPIHVNWKNCCFICIHMRYMYLQIHFITVLTLCFFIESINLFFEHLGHNGSPQLQSRTWENIFTLMLMIAIIKHITEILQYADSLRSIGIFRWEYKNTVVTF